MVHERVHIAIYTELQRPRRAVYLVLCTLRASNLLPSLSITRSIDKRSPTVPPQFASDSGSASSRKCTVDIQCRFIVMSSIYILAVDSPALTAFICDSQQFGLAAEIVERTKESSHQGPRFMCSGDEMVRLFTFKRERERERSREWDLETPVTSVE